MHLFNTWLYFLTTHLLLRLRFSYHHTPHHSHLTPFPLSLSFHISPPINNINTPYTHLPYSFTAFPSHHTCTLPHLTHVVLTTSHSFLTPTQSFHLTISPPSHTTTYPFPSSHSAHLATLTHLSHLRHTPLTRYHTFPSPIHTLFTPYISLPILQIPLTYAHYFPPLNTSAHPNTYDSHTLLHPTPCTPLRTLPHSNTRPLNSISHPHPPFTPWSHTLSATLLPAGGLHDPPLLPTSRARSSHLPPPVRDSGPT